MHQITNTIFNDNEDPNTPTEGRSDKPIASPQPATTTLEEMFGLLTTNQVRGIFHVSSATLYKWRAQRKLGYTRIGRKIFYKVEDLSAFANIHYYKPYKI